MASDIWLRTILIVRKETRCRHIGYSYRLTARVLLYAPSHRQDNTYHGLCYTSRGALAGTRNSSMGPPHEGSIRRPIAPRVNAEAAKNIDSTVKWVLYTDRLKELHQSQWRNYCPPPPPPTHTPFDFWLCTINVMGKNHCPTRPSHAPLPPAPTNFTLYPLN